VQADVNAGVLVWLVHVGLAGRQTLTDFADVRVLKEFSDVLEGSVNSNDFSTAPRRQRIKNTYGRI
jgi:hypothetical protein